MTETEKRDIDIEAGNAHAEWVFREWLEQIEAPVRWSDDLSKWPPMAGRPADELIVPHEVMLDDCPMAAGVLSIFRRRYEFVREQRDLDTLLADQVVLNAAVEVIRHHAKPRLRG